ncbi:MAG: GldM family protein [Agriterribacter sp.]
MRKYLFLPLIFILVCNSPFAQINIINTSLIVPDSNTAFIGVENIFEIVNAGKTAYTLKANGSLVQSTEKPNSFTVKPHSPGADTFHIIMNGKTVFTKIFTLSYLPLPKAALGAINKNTASREEIIANKGLMVRAGNFKAATNMRVLSFLIKIKSATLNEGDELVTINGNLLSEKAIAVITKLKSNDVITFDNIKGAVGPNFCPAGLYSFSITIK